MHDCSIKKTLEIIFSNILNKQYKLYLKLLCRFYLPSFTYGIIESEVTYRKKTSVNSNRFVNAAPPGGDRKHFTKTR